MARVLVIGDTHFPAVHKNYFAFVKKIRDKYKCNEVVHMGDVVDHHCISFHAKHPENEGAVTEYKKAMNYIKQWEKEFPSLKICIGNHDERVFRLASSVGIPDFYLKTYNEVYGTTKWEWMYAHIIDGTRYQHGTGSSSQYPAFNTAKMSAFPIVMGHHHSIAGINWLCGPDRRIFGMDVGCGVDKNRYEMAYGKNLIKKPVISCGVVIDGHPYLELMDM
jgi:predicted phosphodiesterase